MLIKKIYCENILLKILNKITIFYQKSQKFQVWREIFQNISPGKHFSPNHRIFHHKFKIIYRQKDKMFQIYNINT